jgi:hypothetical protein
MVLEEARLVVEELDNSFTEEAASITVDPNKD